MIEVRDVDPETGGEKGRKLARYDLLPWEVIHEVAEHFGLGAIKYAERNWESGYKWSLNFSALHRHLSTWWGGEDTDTENGDSHLAAVLWHAMAMRWFQMHGVGTDDRPVLPAKPYRVYLAGPMRGCILHNFPAFDEAAGRLRVRGWTVISPADLDRAIGYDPNTDPSEAMINEMMRRDIAELVRCDAIALLPNWQGSQGATCELAAARGCGLEILDATTGEPYNW